MSSKICGAVRTIQNEIPGAIWCSCFNHSLNLSIAKGCQIQSIRNAFGQIKEIVNFFNLSSKRNFVLKSCLHAALHSLCETCWIERHTAVLQFLTGLPKILDSLNDITNWDERESSSKAKLLYNSIDCEYIITLYVTSSLFSIILPLSTILQKKSFVINLQMMLLKLGTVNTLKSLCQNCEANFQEIFLKASKQVEDFHIPILKPRTVKKQINRVNYSTDSVDYFHKLSIFSLGIFIPQVLMSQSLEYSEYNLRIIWKQFGNVEEMSKRIVNEEDFIIQLKGELQWWNQLWQDKNCDIPNSALNTLIKCDEEIFPLINMLLTVLTTLPVSVALAERSFSSLRRIKTWMRCRGRWNRYYRYASLKLKNTFGFTLPISAQDIT
ncbi:hypothetical protein QTP88_005313 [Uroleucon formosanum]